jgi:protein-disulfide isomerase
MPRCGKCGKEFDSERGLKVHNAQVHDDGPEMVETVKEASAGNVTFRLNIRHALVLAFAVGIVTGGFVSLMALQVGGATGFITVDGTQAQPTNNNDNTDGNAAPSGNNDGQNQGTPTVDTSKITVDGEPMLGDANAPVTLVMYEDFQCPFCSRFSQNTLTKIKSNYVDSGDVRVVWKDFPIPQLGHDWAVPAANAMECVYRQDNDAFWTVHDRVFDNQQTLTKDTVESKILDWAAAEGVSKDAVNQCLENGNPQQEVQSDRQEGDSFDAQVGGSSFVGGTPSFVIYAESADTGTPIVGAQPYSRFESVIDSKLG